MVKSGANGAATKICLKNVLKEIDGKITFVLLAAV